ncbi:MAG: HD domain-containing protein [Planctomycetota bacterium]|nr:HD domain-containing protein [Planctomycetota bacterium]
MKRASSEADAHPKRVAAIDIGATSVRMKAVEIGRHGALRTIEHAVHPIALGTDTFRLGFISPATVRSLGKVLLNFSRILRENAVSLCKVVGTSAIREAYNREVVIDRLRHISGLTLDLLSAEEETRLTYHALRSFLEANDLARLRRVLAIELGGGSTELMLLRNGNIVACGSRRMGVARLLYGGSGERTDSPVLMQRLIRMTVGSIRDLIGSDPVDACVVVNSLLAGILERFIGKRFRAVEDGRVARAGDIVLAAREISGFSKEEVASRLGLSVAEAEMALPAMMSLQAFTEYTGAMRVFLPDADFLSALIGDMLREMKGEKNTLDFRDQTISCVRGLLERYAVDAAHAEHVRTLAADLFDALTCCLDLDGRDRFILEVAALLHDIGRFINDDDHHKHSMYIINGVDLVGLSESDKRLAALVARYHRKSRPTSSHAEYMALQVEDRMRVSKLAALLRIADALDRGHDRNITLAGVRVNDTEVRISVRAAHDFSAEESALRGKAGLFEDVSGLKVTIKRVWA